MVFLNLLEANVTQVFMLTAHGQTEENGAEWNFFKTEYQLLASEMEEAPSGALT